MTNPTPSLLGAHLFLGMCVVGVTLFFVWAYLGEIDVLSLATGEVIPSSQVKTVQHLEGGMVRDIRVREGDTVQEGQELVILEPVRNEAKVKELQARITSLKIRAIRLRAEAAGFNKLEIPWDIPKALIQQSPREVSEMQDYFNTRKRWIQGQQSIQQSLIIQRTHELSETKAQLESSHELLNYLQEQIAISEQLIKRDLTNRMNHLDLLKESARLRGIIAEGEARRLRLGATIQEGEERLTSIVTTFLEKAKEELASVSGSLTELTQRQNSVMDALRRTILRSPVTGVVKSVYVHTIGEVVQPGGVVLELVPSNDRLVIQAHLPIQEIGFVQLGQKAMVQLASPGTAHFGKIEGVVVHVSPDSMVDQQGIPFYKVRIKTKRIYFEGKNGVRHNLLPGMRTLCAIVTGKRTLLDYLLDPFFGSLDIALRER